jgi:hypothetical protein
MVKIADEVYSIAKQIEKNAGKFNSSEFQS